LDGLTGKLRLEQGSASGRNGTSRSSGTYATFGQRLTIQRGRPPSTVRSIGLDVLALRKNLQVEAGLRLPAPCAFRTCN
jgi:autotransporter translocation and assembly factor TamB